MKTKKICAALLCIALCLALTGCIDLSKLPEFPRASTMEQEGEVTVTAIPVTPEPAATETPAETPEEEIIEEPAVREGDRFCGDWYGWWIITEADGDYEQYAGKWYDICGSAEYNDNNEIELTLKDENGSLGSITLEADGENSLISTGGCFFGVEIGIGTWQLYKDSLGYEGLVCLQDEHFSTENGSFTYTLFMKPWGADWEDVAANANNTEWFFTDMLPYHYEEYLQRVSGGEGIFKW